MNGTYEYLDTYATIVLTPAQTEAKEALSEVLRIGRLIEDSGDACECSTPDPQIGCEVPHDEMADDLNDAIEECVACALAADPSRTRGEILSEIISRLDRLSRHVDWEELLPPATEREIHEYALRRMQLHGLPKLEIAA